MLPSFTFTVDEEPGRRVVVRLEGEMFMGDAGSLVNAVYDLSRRPSAELVLDMAALVAMDSTGLRLLLVTKSMAEGRGVGFKLRNVPDRVFRLLDLFGLANAFDIE